MTQWAYEQKFDGFRAIAFVTPDAVRLQSRAGKELLRYFPELQLPARALRRRRRDRDRRRGRWRGIRTTAAANPPGGVSHHEARNRMARVVRGVRPARTRRQRPARAAVRGAPAGARDDPRPTPRAARPRPRPSCAVAAQHRGGDREAPRHALHPRQAHGDGQGQTPARRSTASSSATGPEKRQTASAR